VLRFRLMVKRGPWVGATKFEARIKEPVEKLPDLAILVEPLLIVRRVLREQSPFCTAACWHCPG
jgi:hypothetical protein